MTNHYTDVCEATIESLRKQLSELKSELKVIGQAIDDPRTDLTMTMSEVIIDQKKQLHAAQADNIRLRAALESAYNGLRWWMDSFPLHVTEADNEEMLKLVEALSATSDLDHLILCEREPVCCSPSCGVLEWVLCGRGEPVGSTLYYRAANVPK